jgi:hypothetical protein
MVSVLTSSGVMVGVLTEWCDGQCAHLEWCDGQCAHLEWCDGQCAHRVV